MTGFVPAGMVPLRTALGRVAQAWLPERWARLRGEDREAFAVDSGREWRRTQFHPAYPVGEEAYVKLRPRAVDGSLPTLMRMPDSGPAVVAPEAWTARSADSLDKVLNGTATLKLVRGESTAGPILLHVADLEAVLRGEPAPSLGTALAVAEPALGLSSPRPRAGRPTNPEGDDFWVEVCRRMLAGEGQSGQSKLTAVMSQWCIDNMRNPYDGETVRKKLGRLFGAIGSE